MKPLRFGTFCTGIDAPGVAWATLGWKPVFMSEIEPAPCAILAHHFPGVPNLGDMTKITDAQIESFGHVDVVCAGTPCQSFSVAGLRKGMADPRGNLALVFLGLLDRIRPRWVVWENVPGVLSSWSDETPGEGERWQTNDFDTFLGGLRELRYGIAWRILDAQHFGVPQRRRRVFVVGHSRDWRRAAAVLFERHSLSGNPPPSRETGARTAACLTRGAESGGKGGYAGRRREDDVNIVVHALDAHMGMGGPDDNAAQANHLVATVHGANNFGVQEIATCLSAKNQRIDGDTETFVVHESLGVPVDSFQNTGKGWWNCSPVAQSIRGSTGGGSHEANVVVQRNRVGVRRLMPIEGERLQGFRDGHTDVSMKGKSIADGPRYKAIGNSMAVPVLVWIGMRIEAVIAAFPGIEVANG